MTISVRNRIILSGTAVIAAFVALFVFSLISLSKLSPAQILDFDTGTPVAPLALVLFCQLLYCAATIVILYLSFRKTTSAEVFFFILFVVTISFDTLKLVHVLLDAAVVAPYFGTIVSRIVYFGRFFGTLSLFACGLFATGMQYERLEVILIAGLLLSFTLATTIPVDMTSLEPWFIMPLGYSREVVSVTTAISLFGVANYLLAAYQLRNRNHLLIAAGLGCAIAGREILFYRLDVLSVIVAFVLLVAGSTIFGERTHEVYLWS